MRSPQSLRIAMLAIPFSFYFINRELGDFRAPGVQFERYEQRISETNEKED